MKIKNLTFLLFLLCIPIISSAKYNVSGISKELLKNSKIVVRNENIVFEVFSKKKAILKVNYALTILNENGVKNSQLKLYYS
jgi:hypothetical protein